MYQKMLIEFLGRWQVIDFSHYKSAIFDCDGVILNSNSIKTQAFRDTLICLGEPENSVSVFIEYHKKNGGVSRYRKFEHYFSEIRPQKSVENSLDKSLKIYAGIVEKELEICPLVEGITEVLSVLNDKGIFCFINSGSDEVELKKVFNRRRLSDYFKIILGSPATKLENMKKLEDASLLNRPVIYFGDAKTDYVASAQYRCDFFFVEKYSDWKNNKEFIMKNSIPVIYDFTELENMIF